MRPPVRSIELGDIARGVTRGEDGIWYGKGEEAVSYPEDGNPDCYQVEDESFWFRHRSRCIESVVERFPPAGTVLDVGGGNGFVARGLQGRGYPVAVLEAGAIGARNARRRGIEQVICSTLETAGFADETIPAIGLFDVLEHLEDDEAMLRTCRRVLVPRGRLYLTVPAMSWLWSSNDENAGHHRRYTRPRLRRLLVSCGFDVHYDTYFFGCLVGPILVTRTLRSLLFPRERRVLEDKRRDHVREDTGTQRFLQTLLDREYVAVAGGRRRPIGSSCLVAAQKATE